MPQRRHHTKSRHGCERCKRRRIKCDENGPPCGYCTARNAECRYPHLLLHQSHLSISLEEPGERWTGETFQPTPNKDTIPDTDGTSNTPPDRMRELQLMHFWCTKTCHSFSPALSPVFQEDVVQEALHHQFLMDSLLALTSLHMAIDQSDDNEPPSLPREFLLYQDRAVPSFRTALENISASNCNALFACATIMMACAAVSPYFQPSQQGTAMNNGIHSDITLLFPFAKGIHSVIEQARPWLAEGPFHSAILIHPEEEWTRTCSLQDNILPSVLRRLLNGTDGDSILFHNTSHSSHDIGSIYERAIGLLESCSRDESMVIPWIVLVGNEFIEQVQSAEHVALLIYICWGALLGRLEGIWWARVAGKTIVRHISDLVSVEHAAWDEVVAWAKEMIE